jgi:hypothetical protein
MKGQTAARWFVRRMKHEAGDAGITRVDQGVSYLERLVAKPVKTVPSFGPAKRGAYRNPFRIKG